MHMNISICSQSENICIKTQPMFLLRTVDITNQPNQTIKQSNIAVCYFFPVSDSEVAERPATRVDKLLPEIQGQGHPAVSCRTMVECLCSWGQHPADGGSVWQETPMYCSLFSVLCRDIELK